VLKASISRALLALAPTHTSFMAPAISPFSHHTTPRRTAPQVNGRVLLGMVGYDSMAAAVFEALRAELSLRTMRLQHHVSRSYRGQGTMPRAVGRLDQSIDGGLRSFYYSFSAFDDGVRVPLTYKADLIDQLPNPDRASARRPRPSAPRPWPCSSPTSSTSASAGRAPRPSSRAWTRSSRLCSVPRVRLLLPLPPLMVLLELVIDCLAGAGGRDWGGWSVCLSVCLADWPDC